MIPPNTKKTFRTTETLKEELLLKNEAYANGEFEIVGEFVSMSTLIEVKDKYGVLLMKPESLIANAKPRLLSAVDKNAYFREMIKEVWGDEVPNILSDYLDSKTKLRVEKGGYYFLVWPSSLLIKTKYDIPENAEDKNVYAVGRLKEVHGDRYDYSKVNYTGDGKKITIICKEHGEFEQVYNVHSRGCHCPKCAKGQTNESVAAIVNKDNFLQELEKRNEAYRNGELKILGDYQALSLHILVEDKYGKALMQPKVLLKGVVPCLATAIDKTEYFKNKATDVHNGTYTYDNAVYKGSGTKITVTCPIHGDFEQQVDTHLSGAGCMACKNEKVGWTYTAWSKAALGNPGILYILRCWNDEEEFYKVGITCQSKVGDRYHNKLRMPYKYEVVKEIIDHDREYVYKLEKQIKREHKKLAYKPKINFDGSKSECFTKLNITL